MLSITEIITSHYHVLKITFTVMFLQTSAINKRVGTLNMGIILQSAYRQVSSSANDVHYVTTNAKFPCNQNKNRQGAPLPPNSTRVKLQMVEDDLGSDYINARFRQRIKN